MGGEPIRVGLHVANERTLAIAPWELDALGEQLAVRVVPTAAVNIANTR